MDGSDAPAPREEHPKAAAILAAAGWKPHNEWNVFTRGTLVMGWEPSGTAFHVKNTARCADGPDTPDDPVEAARWLVARFPAPVNDLSTEATLEPPAVDVAPEEAEIPAHETHGETGEEVTPGSGDLAGDGEAFALRAEGQATESEPPVDESGSEPETAGVEGGEAIFDADFGELDPAPEELSAELLDTNYVRDPLLLDEPEVEAVATGPEDEPPGAQFIFGDNLDQMRTAAIGLVMRHARSLMPFWTTDQDVALIELRNFTMGVAEGRWPDDEGRRAELDTLEATLSRIGAITQARDAKVEFLESASREQIEGFDATADWP